MQPLPSYGLMSRLNRQNVQRYATYNNKDATYFRSHCVFYNTSHTTTKLTIADFVQAGAFGQKLHFQIFISYVDYSKHS